MKWAMPKRTVSKVLVVVGTLVLIVSIGYGAYAIWVSPSLEKNNTASDESNNTGQTEVTQEDRDISKMIAQGKGEDVAKIYIQKAEQADTPVKKANWYTQASATYFNAGNSELALESAQKAYDIGNPSSGTLSTLAMLYEQKGDYAKAIEVYRQLVTQFKATEEGRGYVDQYESHITSLEEKL